MDFQLSEEEVSIQKATREFVDKVIVPRAAEIDETDEFPRDILKKIAEVNLLDLELSPELGGLGMAGVPAAITAEEVARGSAAMSGLLTSFRQNMWILEKFGTPAQQEKWIPGMASGDIIPSFALTEPNAGSDAGGVTTTAELEGDEYVINGTKTFCTLAPVADFTHVVALTDRSKGKKSLSCIIVESDRPGYMVGKHERKMGQRGNPVAEIHFENVRVPRENLVGKEGEGFKIALSSLDPARIYVAALALGIMQASLEASVKYAKQRVQFGQPIAEFQAIQWMIADMRTSLEAARLLTYQAAFLMTTGRRYTLEAAMAKLFATDECMKHVSNAVQIHGGYGYMKDYPVERYFRDTKITQIYDGTNEIQRLVIARQVLEAIK
ncbi:MAG: acyl-CoA dehydrogenase [Firmicutes bacterium]|nr:acyl-CoA dehydrogenase [Bacillota bacterium]